MQFSIHNPLIIEIINFDCKDCLGFILDYLYSHRLAKYGDEHEDHLKHLIKLLIVHELDEVFNHNDKESTGQKVNNADYLKMEDIEPVTTAPTYQYKFVYVCVQLMIDNIICYTFQSPIGQTVPIENAPMPWLYV